MGVRIIIDSASDIRKEDAERRGFLFAPLKTIINGEEYNDGVDLTTDEFYNKLAASKELAGTSQVTPAEFEALYKKVTDDGDEAVVITISSKLSGTNQSAVIAAEGYQGKIYVVDSLNATVGEQVLIEQAVRLCEQGRSAKEIFDELEVLKGRVRLVARVDTLEYLMRGGRVSKGAAIVGEVLGIKPILAITDGVIVTLGKARGTKGSHSMVNENIEKAGEIDFSMPVAMAYSGKDKGILDKYIAASGELWEGKLEGIPVSVLGSTIGTHVGPGAFIVSFIAKN